MLLLVLLPSSSSFSLSRLLVVFSLLFFNVCYCSLVLFCFDGLFTCYVFICTPSFPSPPVLLLFKLFWSLAFIFSLKNFGVYCSAWLCTAVLNSLTPYLLFLYLQCSFFSLSSMSALFFVWMGSYSSFTSSLECWVFCSVYFQCLKSLCHLYFSFPHRVLFKRVLIFHLFLL